MNKKSKEFLEKLKYGIDETKAEEIIRKYRNYGFGPAGGYTLEYLRNKMDLIKSYADYSYFTYKDGDHTKEFQEAIRYLEYAAIKKVYDLANNGGAVEGSRGSCTMSNYPYTIYLSERNDEAAEKIMEKEWATSPRYKGESAKYPGLVCYSGEWLSTD